MGLRDNLPGVLSRGDSELEVALYNKGYYDPSLQEIIESSVTGRRRFSPQDSEFYHDVEQSELEVSYTGCEENLVGNSEVFLGQEVLGKLDSYFKQKDKAFYENNILPMGDNDRGIPMLTKSSWDQAAADAIFGGG